MTRRQVNASLVGAISLPGALIGYKIVHWLHFGNWPENTVGWGFDRIGADLPLATWVGAQALIDWFAAQPLSYGLVLAGGALGLCLASVSDARELVEENPLQPARRLTRGGEVAIPIPKKDAVSLIP